MVSIVYLVLPSTYAITFALILLIFTGVFNPSSLEPNEVLSYSLSETILVASILLAISSIGSIISAYFMLQVEGEMEKVFPKMILNGMPGQIIAFAGLALALFMTRSVL